MNEIHTDIDSKSVSEKIEYKTTDKTIPKLNNPILMSCLILYLNIVSKIYFSQVKNKLVV